MMSSSWRDLTLEMRTTCERKNAQLEIPWPTLLRMRPQVGQDMGKTILNTRLGNSGTTRTTKDSGRKDTVAVPELQRFTGTAQGISNRGQCVRTGAVPELKSL